MVAWGRILLLTLVSALVVAGCGGNGDDIPEEDAEVLLLRLDEIERGLERGNCEDAQASADLLVEQVAQGELGRVPADVDPEVRELLEEGAANLSELVGRDCEPVEEEPVEIPEEMPDEAPEEPVEPVEPEPEEDEAPPPDPPGQGGGQGQGEGGGQGQGGEPPSGGTDID